MNFPDFIKRDFSLRSLNTFGIDETASLYMEVKTVDDLMQVCRIPSLMQMPRLIVGGGSNILLTGHFKGLALRMAMKGMCIEREDDDYVYVRAAAGEKWHDLVSWTLENGLGGLENLSWIPGTVGAAPVQNIGAYGAELKDTFFSLRAFDFEKGALVELNKGDCRFAYRDSVFKNALKNRAAIVEVTLALPKEWKPNMAYAEIEREIKRRGITEPAPAEISSIIVEIRQRKLPDPAVLGNAGSFFKNPTLTAEKLSELRIYHPEMPAYIQPDGCYRVAAGWLIDQCGWKGRRMGNAGVCETQALVLVNHGRASGTDIVALAMAIEKEVYDRFAIQLEPEPVFV